jgi:putative hydrolase of the HAD superfamily
VKKIKRKSKEMINVNKQQVYLFDWGDTLMVDFPEQQGKMCDWSKVAAIDNSVETLSKLSKTASIYVATSAIDSSEKDIKKAFQRVGLDEFIDGYFCTQNVGFSKGEDGFLQAILTTLDCKSSQVFMVGDNIEKDILPALKQGITPILFTAKGTLLNKEPIGQVRVIDCLSELIEVG